MGLKPPYYLKEKRAIGSYLLPKPRISLTHHINMRTQNSNSGSFREYLRFGVSGALNTTTDFIVLNALLWASGPVIASGAYIAWKTISFLCALIQSYFLNKFWVFSSAKSTGIDAKESGRFFVISLIGFLINVTGSFLTFFALSHAGVDSKIAGNIGAVIGTALTVFWNYNGYKAFVFKIPTRV